MPATMLRTMAVVAFCLCDGAFAVAFAQPRHAAAHGPALSVRSADTPVRASRLQRNAARTPVAGRHGHADPAEPYKANRLSSPRVSEPILNIPGQTTVLTREVLDDMKATSVRDALRSTAGVTIGR